MGMVSDKHWIAQLDEEASARRDRSSFHVFAEGQHSDVRGQIYNLDEGAELVLPHDRWPHHLFIVIGIDGVVEALVEGSLHSLRGHTQLVITPGTPCKLVARTAAAVELLSLFSTPPQATV
jgi:hypothetical protein